MEPVPSQRPTRPAGIALACLALGCGLVACGLLGGESDDTPVLARVGDRVLRTSAVGELVPAGTPPDDSVAILRDYALRWAREATVSNEAAEAVGDDAGIERLVADYRVGLQRQRFEEELLARAIDTAITVDEYEGLYTELDESVAAPHQLVRAFVLKVPTDHPRLGELERAWNASDGEDASPELRALASEVAVLALLDASRWYEAPQLRLLVPGIEGDVPAGSRVIGEGGDRYFVRVFERVSRGARAPLAYLEPRLRKLILEQRRAAYLDEYINRVFREAEARDEVHIYVGNAN